MRRSMIALAALLAMIAGAAAAQDPAPSDVRDLIGARAAGGETQLQNRGYVHVKTETGSDRKWSNWWNPRTRTCLSVVTYDGRYSSIVTAPAPDCNQRATASGSSATPSDVRDLVGARAAGGETALKSRGYAYVKTETGSGRKWTNWWNARNRTCLSVVTSDGRYSSIVSAPAADCKQQSSASTTHAVYNGIPVLRLRNGSFQVTMTGGCTVWFRSNGTLLSSMPKCDSTQRAQATLAVLRFRREHP